MFNHNLVKPNTIKRTNINGKRYYILPDGVTKLKSVTTVISENKDNSGIIKWRNRVGNVEANRITGISTSRGTSIHKMAEKFVLNEQYIDEKTMPSNLEMFNPIKKTLEEHVNNIRGVELPLYSTFLRTAGSTDLVAEYDKNLSIIDFKNSRRLKKEEYIQDYFIQASTYALMFRGLYDEAVDQIVLIITVENESESQIFVKNIRDYIPMVKKYFLQ